MKNKKCDEKNMLSESAAASISVYLILMLVLVLVLVCTLIESGRVSAMNAKLKAVTYMSTDAVFSQYARPVFEDYGVMFLWCNEEAFNLRFMKFADKNLQEASLQLIGSADLYHISYSSSKVTKTEWATDDNGKIFEDQVDDYMKYHFTEEQAKKLLSKVDIYEQGNKVNDFFEKINKYESVFEKVEKSVGKVKEKAESLHARSDAPSQNLDAMQKSADAYKKDKKEADKNNFYNNEQLLKNTKQDLTASLEDVISATSEYHANVADAEQAIASIETEISVDEADYDSETYEILAQEIQEIRERSGEFEADYYGIEDSIETSLRHIDELNSLDDMFAQIDSSEAFDAEAFGELVTTYKDRFAGFSLSDISVNYDTSQVQKENSDFLNTVQKILNKGVLGYVAENVSDKSIDKKDLPSVTVSNSKNNADESLLKQTSKKAIFSEYVREHFGNYTDIKKNRPLDYETEYVIAGKNSDEKNLGSVVDRLIAIRTGCNAVSLLKDGEKKAEALSLATAIIGFTGMPILVKLMQLAILGAWAAAEAVTDVKTLLQGEKVSTIKNSAEWNISLSGLKNFSKADIKGKGSKTGLDYGGYLRILLLSENREKQIFQTMDMIQANMTKNENEKFRIKNCLNAVTIEAEFKAPVLFISIPLVSRQVGRTEGSYVFNVVQDYSY